MKNKPKNSQAEVSIKVKPLYDRVLIKEDDDSGKKSVEKRTSSGIIIPVTVDEDKGGKRGKIVAVGSGKMEDGKIVPLSVKVGDVVLFQWGDKIKLSEGDSHGSDLSTEYYIVRESEILAIIG